MVEVRRRERSEVVIKINAKIGERWTTSERNAAVSSAREEKRETFFQSTHGREPMTRRGSGDERVAVDKTFQANLVAPFDPTVSLFSPGLAARGTVGVARPGPTPNRPLGLSAAGECSCVLGQNFPDRHPALTFRTGELVAFATRRNKCPAVSCTVGPKTFLPFPRSTFFAFCLRCSLFFASSFYAFPNDDSVTSLLLAQWDIARSIKRQRCVNAVFHLL